MKVLKSKWAGDLARYYEKCLHSFAYGTTHPNQCVGCGARHWEVTLYIEHEAKPTKKSRRGKKK